MLKIFRDLTKGDRALSTQTTPQWVVIESPPEPIDDSNPLGLWRVDIKGGDWLESALTEVLVNA